MKTSIAIKAIFESSPVSRSQAKSPYSNLESGEKAVLDFEGVEWMGQGFAHQIFVVFQREHPDIALTPVNMNDGVEKMYKHVIPSK